MVFVVVGTHTKRVINEFALEQGLIIWFFNVTHKWTVQIWGDLPHNWLIENIKKKKFANSAFQSQKMCVKLDNTISQHKWVLESTESSLLDVWLIVKTDIHWFGKRLFKQTVSWDTLQTPDRVTVLTFWDVKVLLIGIIKPSTYPHHVIMKHVFSVCRFFCFPSEKLWISSGKWTSPTS